AGLIGSTADLQGEVARAAVATVGNERKKKQVHFAEKRKELNRGIACTSRAMRRSSNSSRCGGKQPGSRLSCYYHAPALLFHLLVVSSRCTAAVSASKCRAQIVSVSAPWPTSCLSPLAEASEFVAEGDGGGSGGAAGGGGALFWDYVEAVGGAPREVFSCSRGSSAGQGEEETGEVSPSSSAASGAEGQDKEGESSGAQAGPGLPRDPAAAIDG
ncbi:unnamed protein product, partial [Laminaria digitata]